MCERGQQGGGGRGERTQVGVGWASCQHPQKEKDGGLEAGGSGHSRGALLLSQWMQVWALYWPKDVPTAPLWPSPFFPFIFIYLLTFMKSPYHPIPNAHVVLTIPPAIQLSVQLSVCLSQGK